MKGTHCDLCGKDISGADRWSFPPYNYNPAAGALILCRGCYDTAKAKRELVLDATIKAAKISERDEAASKFFRLSNRIIAVAKTNEEALTYAITQQRTAFDELVAIINKETENEEAPA